MKINGTLIKSALAMLGMSLKDIQEKATPAIEQQLDAFLEGQEIGEGQRPAIVITKNNKGKYFIVRSILNNAASEKFLHPEAFIPLEDLVGKVINQLD